MAHHFFILILSLSFLMTGCQEKEDALEDLDSLVIYDEEEDDIYTRDDNALVGDLIPLPQESLIQEESELR